MFEGFTPRRVLCGDVEIHAVVGGQGPALLLLHGHPQTHVIWHKVAAALARHFTVVATDLQGDVVCDVTSMESCRAAVATTLERHGQLDILCNVAGIGMHLN